MREFKKNSVIVALAIFLTFGFAGLVRAATTVNLGTADNFAILAGTGITIGGAVNTSTITGDIGSYSTPTIIGIGNAVLNGTNHAGDATTQAAKTDLATAYSAAGQSATQVPTELGSTTKLPGVYNSLDGTFGMTGTLTLDAQGDPNAVFIFRTASTLITAGASNVSLTGGAQACNVFWQVGSSATLGAASTFKGNILALTSIGLGTTANVEGRVLAQNGAVTLDGSDVIAKATCAPPPTTTSNTQALTCNPATQSVAIDQSALFIAGGGIGNFGWLAPGGNSSNTNTNAFSASYSTSGTKTVNLTSGGQSATCTVYVAPAAIPPLINVVKVPTPLALPLGPGLVTYDYRVLNVGEVAMSNVTLTDNMCSPTSLISGDVNGNTLLDTNETWRYRCATTLATTTTNIAIASGQANGLTATDIATAEVVVGSPVVPPLIHVVKKPNVFVLPPEGGAVTYMYTVTNPGTVPLNNVSITDDKCTGLPGRVVGHPGDLNKNNLLESNESWSFTCQTYLTKTTTNVGTAKGYANNLTAVDLSPATVVVAPPKLPNTGLPPQNKSTPLGIFILFGIFMVSLVYIIQKKHIA